jgi:hypothetical protein
LVSNDERCNDPTCTVPARWDLGRGPIAPAALSLGAALRVKRLSHGQSPDVIHLLEPLAPVINYAYPSFPLRCRLSGRFTGRDVAHGIED